MNKSLFNWTIGSNFLECDNMRARYNLTKIESFVVEEKEVIHGPADVASLSKKKELFGDNCREMFYAISLNTKNRVITIPIISIGSLNASIVHPREVLKPAIGASAASIVLLHNHPSGDPNPSKEDIEFSRKMVKAAEIIGIQLLDHVIVCENSSYYSMKENGVI